MKKNIQLILGVLLLLFVSAQAYAQCGDEITNFEVTNVTNASCFGGQDGSVSVRITGGEAPFVYELWVDQGGSGNTKLQESPSTNDTEHTFTNLFAESIVGGNYFTVVKTSNTHTSGNATLTQLCSERQLSNIDLTNPDQMANSVDLAIPSCAGNDGEILLTTTGGTAPYTYTWTSVPVGQAALGNTNNPTALAPGDYTVEIVDVNNCPLAGFGGPIVENITIAASPVVTDQTPAVCEDAQGAGQATGLDLTAFEPAINGEVGTTFAWYNDALLTNAVADDTDATATDGQQFFVEVDNGSCQSVATLTYTINAFPSDPSNLQATGVVCDAFTANWDVSTDAVEYVVSIVRESDNAILSPRTVADNTPQLFNGLDTYADYHFTVLARNACGESSTVVSASFTTDGIPPVPTGLASANVVCDGFDAVWNAVANATSYTVEVYQEAGLINLEASQSIPAPATPGVSVSFNGLASGATFFFRVRAENACGDGAYSTAESVTMDDVPADPTNVVAQNISCTSLDANWDAVPNTIDYTVEFIDVDAGETFAAPGRTETVVAPAASFAFGGLTAGTQYQFRVRARNACGVSNNVASAVVSTNAVPVAPTGLASSNVLCNSFDVQWNAVGDADSYNVEVYEDAGLTVLNSAQNIVAPATSTTFGGLTIGTTYYFHVNTVGDCGTSSFTAAANSTTDNVPTTPAAPQATNVSCTAFDASWTAATNANDYVIEVIDIDAGANFAAPTFTQTIAAAATSVNFAGLTAGNQYQFRVRASNACGESGNVTSAVFSTDALPAVPTGLTSLNPTCVGFDAQWNLVADADNYTVEVYDDAGLTNLVATQLIGAPTTSFTFNTLAGGTAHFFRVRAENVCGNSAFTTEETVTTAALPADPSNPLTNNVTCTAFDASWTASASGADEYVVELIDVTAGSTFAAPDRTETIAQPGTSFAFSGLVSNNQYQFRVRASNVCGESSNATSAVFSTGALPTANDQTPTVCEDSPGNGATVDLTALHAAIDGGAGHTITWFEDVALASAVADPTTVVANDGDDFFARVDDGTCQDVAAVTYTVNSVPDASFTYTTGTFCQDAGAQLPTVATGGGTFTADAGLVINGATGEIDVATSTLGGPYTVTYNLAGACPSSATFEVTITNTPNAVFEYGTDEYCQDAGVQAPGFPTGGSGGTFSANSANLIIDAGTGVIDPAASLPGLYIVTNTIAANGSCPQVTDDYPVEILGQDDATFTYNASYCQDDADPTANITGDVGTFSAPAGLVFLDNVTGEIDLSASTPATYTITYTTNASACTASSTFDVTINAAEDATFSYVTNAFCQSEGAAIPNAITSPGGTFSAPAGLVFADATTGEINLTGSTPGTYAVTYTTGGACPAISAPLDITINAAPTANDQAPAVCEDTPGSGSTTVDLTALETAIDGGAGHIITWFEDVALASAVANPANVTATNGDDFFAQVDNGTCQDVATVTYTVNSTPVVANQTPTVCENTAGSGNATVDLTALEGTIDGGAGHTYAWFEDAALTIPVADPTNATATTGTDFFAQASDGTCQNMATVTYTVQALPSVSFAGLTSPYCATDGAVVLTGSENPDGTFAGPGITDNGNGTASFDPAVAGIGSHTITYSYTDGSGCASQSSQTAVVNDCTGPATPNFSADVTSICENGTVTFTNQSSGAITTYDWDFGIGATPATATGPGPHAVMYSIIGTATVSLTVDGPITETKTDFITINASDDAGFGYDVAAHCPDGADPTPSFINTPGGDFTAAPAGLVINATTGTVDLSASTPGVLYTITYTTDGTCPTSSTFDLTIQDFADPSFNYAPDTYCQIDANPIANITGDAGGLFTAPAGLILADVATGEIDLAGSTPGVYDITYTVGACPISQTFEVTIVGSQSAAFSYASATFCFDGIDPQPEPGYVVGGTFSTTDPVVIDPNDGTIDVSASTVGGPYNITYTIGSGSCIDIETFDVSITNTTADPTFRYSAAEYCVQPGNTAPIFDPGTSAGEFSFTTTSGGVLSLAIDGSIDLAASDPGTYRVTNFIQGSGGSCADVLHEEKVQIIAPDVADISYAGPFCQSDPTDPTPVFAPGSTTNGTFSVVSGNAADMTIVAATGLIDLSDTDPGTYDIEYETTGLCPSSVTVSVTIEAATDATFSYPAATFCIGSGTVLPNPGFTAPGEFTAAEAGLVFVGGAPSTTGEIDLNASAVGDYTITYQTTLPGCNGLETRIISIQEATASAGVDDTACKLRYDLAGNDPGTATGEWLVTSTPTGAETVTFTNRFAHDTQVRVSDKGLYEFEWQVTQGGCVVADPVEIEFFYPIETFLIANTPVPSCAGGASQYGIAAGGGSESLTFAWSPGAGDASTFDDDFIATDFFGTLFNPDRGGRFEYRDNVPAGIHSVTITDNILGCDTTITFTMATQELDDVLTVNGTAICTTGSDGEITVTSTDVADTHEYTITYFDEDGNAIGTPATLDTNTDTDVMVGGFAAGTYFLDIEVTNGPDAGCKTAKEVTIDEHAAPTVSVVDITDASCVGTNDGSIDINVGGGADSFTWNDSDGNPVPGGTLEDLTNVLVGDYTVDITYQGGSCTETFGPFTINPQTTSDGPTADAPLATSIQCSSFEARWSNDGPNYLLDVAEDENFTTFVLQDEPVATNSYVVSGASIQPGTDYWYRVRTVAATGCISDYSNVINVTTVTGPVPTVQPATGVGCDAFTANWAPVAGAIGYEVEVATDAAFTSILPAFIPAQAPAPVTDTKLTVSGLNGAQTYFYRVRVETACGTSAYTAPASVTTDGLTEAPTNLAASSITCIDAVISWQAVGTPVSRYEVFLDDDGDFLNGTLSPTADATEVANTTTTVVLPTPGDTYFYHVLAILDGCNTTMTAGVSFTASDEPAVPVPTATSPTCNGFTLAWPAVADADEYVVQFSKDGFVNTVETTIPGTSLVLDTLTQGKTYEYQVKARGCIESAFSALGTVDTQDIPVGLANAPTASASSCNGFTVSWETIADATHYVVQASADGFVTPPEEVVVDATELSATFTTLSVATSYEYRVAVRNACGDGSFTAGATLQATNPEADCGCGFDKMRYVVNPINETCPGSQDGSLQLTILELSTSIDRFQYRYYSLTNPADSSAGWEDARNTVLGNPVWSASDLPAGDYKVKVLDTNVQVGCASQDSVTVTIKPQNDFAVAPIAETCETPGAAIVKMPAICLNEDRVYWVEVINSETSFPVTRNEALEGLESFEELTITELPGGDYQLKIIDLTDPDIVYDTLSVTVPNNCSSGGGEPPLVCNLNGITFLPETTLAECDNGQGSVTFVALNNTDEEFTFTVIEEGGVVFDTKVGSSGITFENLPSRRYTYEIFDALSQSCRGGFTVGAKSVSFEATIEDAIACDAITTQINVAIDTAATLAAGPYEIVVVDQADTLASLSLPLGTYQTSFTDIPVGKTYGVVIRPAAEDACVVRRDVEAMAPGTAAIQFTYQLDSGTCYTDGGSGSVTISDIVVAENEAFQVNVINVITQQTVQTRQFPIKPESYTFAGLANGQYQVQLSQQQSSCATVVREKRSETFVIEGAERALVASIRSHVEVTVNYPYGTIEIDSITGGGAPYEVRIAADPNGATTEWIAVVNENPIVRPYRHEYLDQAVGTYVMEVRDRFGCVFTRTVEVGYTSELYIPNIFTPNGDGGERYVLHPESGRLRRERRSTNKNHQPLG